MQETRTDEEGECLVINFNVEPRMEGITQVPGGNDKDMRDIELMGKAMRDLMEGDRIAKVLIRRLEKMLRAM